MVKPKMGRWGRGRSGKEVNNHHDVIKQNPVGLMHPRPSLMFASRSEVSHLLTTKCIKVIHGLKSS